MAKKLRRQYTVFTNGNLHVQDSIKGDLSEEYQNIPPVEGVARVEADLYIAEDLSVIALKENGCGQSSAQACIDLVTLFSADDRLPADKKRSFK
jgi:hypothetical protein